MKISGIATLADAETQTVSDVLAFINAEFARQQNVHAADAMEAMFLKALNGVHALAKQGSEVCQKIRPLLEEAHPKNMTEECIARRVTYCVEIAQIIREWMPAEIESEEEEENVDIVQQLRDCLSVGAQNGTLNEPVHDEKTVLMLACELGIFPVVEEAIACGCDVNHVAPSGGTALDGACIAGDASVVRHLLDHGANVHIGNSCLYSASLQGYEEIVDMLLSVEGIVIDQIASTSLTPVMAAAMNGHVAIVEKLLKRGANVNMQSKTGATALYYATQYNRLNVLRILRANGGNVNLARFDGATCLLLAAHDGFVEVCEWLCDNGATIDAVDNIGNSPLMMSCMTSKKDVVELLIARGASIDCVNVKGETALGLTTNAEIVQLLSGRAVRSRRV